MSEEQSINTPPHLTNPAVSLIIPMYNAEKYIGECLESVLVQTFKDFEVIVVDDCSTDSSCEIVESYIPKFDGRLRLASMEENTGSGALPKNRGLMLSRGEYIAFLDDDDMLTKTAFEELYKLAKDYAADVVYCEKNYSVDDDGTNLRVYSRPPVDFTDKPVFDSEDIVDRYNNLMKWRYSVIQWRKFVKRSLIMENELFFPPTCPSDDDIWTIGLVLCAKKLLRVPNIVYINRSTKNSIMHARKTVEQGVNFWINPLLFGMKNLDKMIEPHEYFKKNPTNHFYLLEAFLVGKISYAFKNFGQIASKDVYRVIREKYGKKFGEYDVLIPALFAALHRDKVLFDRLKKSADEANERVVELERELKILKTNNRIAELERELQKLKSERIFELESELKKLKA